MRRSIRLLVLKLLIGTAACGTADDADDERASEGRGNPGIGERGSRVGPDASASPAPGASAADTGVVVPVDAGQVPARAADVDTFLPLADCAQTPTASAACSAPDLFEPNDEAPLSLTAGEGCSLVPGKLASTRDIDLYSFSTTRADPVRVTLAYETTPASAVDLRVVVRDPMRNALLSSPGRADATWSWSNTFVAKKGFAYEIDVSDRGKSECQGYNLKVEPNFCTDRYEDNDAQAEAAQGIRYGETLAATLFGGDDDWYDLSAVQAAGATCIVTFPELTLKSRERLDVTFRTGAENSVLSGSLDGTSGTTSKTFTLKAGSGAAAVRLHSTERVCSPYTVVCNPL
ncbi:MAG TPA: hypothetical protein VI299_13655 [Polyangiales bacterium]